GTPEQAAALLAATRDGDIERALALVEAGADPATAPLTADRDQRPVLMLAALLPDTRLLRALIAKGADVNRASGGLTPRLAATRESCHGRAEAVMIRSPPTPRAAPPCTARCSARNRWWRRCCWTPARRSMRWTRPVPARSRWPAAPRTGRWRNSCSNAVRSPHRRTASPPWSPPPASPTTIPPA